MPRDELTGLPGAEAARAILAAWRQNPVPDAAAQTTHAMLIALDRFDTINLAYGEAAGDGALVEVARRILHFAEDEFGEGEWFAARMGGGKFLLAAREACSRERWLWLAEALADLIAHPIAGVGDAGTLRLWPRVALMRVLAAETADLIVDRLAETLASVRARHGSRILWADKTTTLPGRRAAELEADLLAALDRNEIEILFQPQFTLENDRVVGAEALARWQHPQLGRVGAGALFAIAARADQEAQLSRHVAVNALRQAAEWPEHLRLSLNVTPADLAASDFAPSLMRLVEESGFAPERLTLEITEQVLLSDLERAAAALGQLREGGVQMALDDFGAGFCNFRYLKLLPLEGLKIDRAMIEGIVEDERDLAVLRGIVAMAKALGLKIIVEGVESEEQRRLLHEEGCDLYQGFLRAPPLPADEFASFVEL